MSNSFGALLKKYRKNCRVDSNGKLLTQELLAEELPLSSQTISAWERGTRAPTNRDDVLLILPVFYQMGGIRTLIDANLLLKSAEFYPLQPDEVEKFAPEWVAQVEDSGNEEQLVIDAGKSIFNGDEDSEHQKPTEIQIEQLQKTSSSDLAPHTSPTLIIRTNRSVKIVVIIASCALLIALLIFLSPNFTKLFSPNSEIGVTPTFILQTPPIGTVVTLAPASDVTSMTTATTDGSMDLDNLRGAAMAALIQGDYPAAIKPYSQLIELEPTVADHYIKRGVAYMNTEQEELAIEDFSSAIELNPDDAETYNLRGSVHINTQKYELAVEDFTQAIERNEEKDTYYNSRAIANMALGNIEMTIADYQQVLEVSNNPDLIERVQQQLINLGVEINPENSSESAAPDRTGYIVFTSDRQDDSEVYLINPQNSELFQLTENQVDDRFPEWLPDGRIAFASVNEGKSEFYSIKTDGTELAIRSYEEMRSWSPDQSVVAYLQSRNGQRDLFVSDANGANEVRLTQNDANDWYPLWSPDGDSLLFMSERDGNDEIYWTKADGSAAIRLTNNEAKDYLPVWSPDGTQIAFVSDRDGNNEIYVMNADGTEQTRLTNAEGEDTSPDWSPDGQQLVFESYRDGNDEIYVMNADGSAQRNLTKSPASDRSPDWSP